MDITIR